MATTGKFVNALSLSSANVLSRSDSSVSIDALDCVVCMLCRYSSIEAEYVIASLNSCVLSVGYCIFML